MAKYESFSTPGWVDGWRATLNVGASPDFGGGSHVEGFGSGWLGLSDYLFALDSAVEATFSAVLPHDIEQFSSGWTGISTYKIGFGGVPGGPTTMGTDGFPVPGVDPNAGDAALVAGIVESFESGWDNDAWEDVFSGGDVVAASFNGSFADSIESFQRVYADQQVTVLTGNVFATANGSAAPQAASTITLLVGSGSALPSPLQPKTPYACLAVAGHSDRFQVAPFGSSSAITFTDNGNGTMTVRGDPSLFWVGDDVID